MNSFSFYNNYYELIKHLKKEDRLAMYDAILKYMFEDIEPNFTGLKKGLWINIKMPLDTSKTNYFNGKKGGAPKGNTNAKKTTEKQPKNNRKTTEHTTEKQTNNISYFLFLISNNKYKYINSNIKLNNKIKEWLEYKEERKEKYKETGLKSLLTEIENNVDIYGVENIINLINECMASNYRGIIFDKLKNKRVIKKENVPDWINDETLNKKEKEVQLTGEAKRIYEKLTSNSRK